MSAALREYKLKVPVAAGTKVKLVQHTGPHSVLGRVTSDGCVGDEMLEVKIEACSSGWGGHYLVGSVNIFILSYWQVFVADNLPSDYVPEYVDPRKACVCDMVLLMREGCRCGGV